MSCRLWHRFKNEWFCNLMNSKYTIVRILFCSYCFNSQKFECSQLSKTSSFENIFHILLYRKERIFNNLLSGHHAVVWLPTLEMPWFFLFNSYSPHPDICLLLGQTVQEFDRPWWRLNFFSTKYHIHYNTLVAQAHYLITWMWNQCIVFVCFYFGEKRAIL